MTTAPSQDPNKKSSNPLAEVTLLCSQEDRARSLWSWSAKIHVGLIVNVQASFPYLNLMISHLYIVFKAMHSLPKWWVAFMYKIKEGGVIQRRNGSNGKKLIRLAIQA